MSLHAWNQVHWWYWHMTHAVGVERHVVCLLLLSLATITAQRKMYSLMAGQPARLGPKSGGHFRTIID